jgi:glycosyltransferase involved in cell wall biosynthesis
MPQAWRNRYFLASNRFIEKKNLPKLLRSYAAFRFGRTADPADWPLVMLGDGEMYDELQALTAALGLQAHVHYPGFRQIGELPVYYATAGAFVHVSTTEQWGLVINEALASGLPAIVSRRCGCAEVLIAHDVNGLLIDPYDSADITDALVRIAHPDVRDRLAGQAARQVIDWGPDRFGTGIRDAASFAIREMQVRPNLIDRQCLKMAISRLA